MAEPATEIKVECQFTPVAWDFIQDDSFLRGIKGPVGTGKSTACCLEVYRRGCLQVPGEMELYGKLEQVRKTRWAIIRNCFDDHTEVLTESRGWQFFKDLLPEDKVATLYDGETLGFEKPSHYYAAPHKGEMIGLKCEGIDMLVTPNHKLYTSKKYGRAQRWLDFDFEFAHDAYGKVGRKFKRSVKWEGHKSDHSEDYFEFLGYWFAEGHCGAYEYPDRKNPHWRLVLSTKNDLWYAKRVLDRVGLKYGVSTAPEGCHHLSVKLSIQVKALILELLPCGHALTKFVPQWVKDAPARHISAFLRGFIHGDGGLTGGGKTVAAYTSSKRLADDLQEMAIKAGLVANLSFRDREPNGKSYSVGNREYVITFISPARANPKTRGWFKQDYDGMVYCVEVSTHAIMVRRNGKNYISSQTYPELRTTTIKSWVMWFPEDRYPIRYGTPFDTRIRGRLQDGTVVDMEIFFVALDQPKHVAKLLSMELTGAWINEAKEIPKSILDGVTQRVGRYPEKKHSPLTWSGVFMDTNPPDTDSWWHKAAEEETPVGWKFWSQPPILNKSRDGKTWVQHPKAEGVEYQPKGLKYWIDMIPGKTVEWIKVYILGQYGTTMDGKPVYPEYSDDAHCREIVPVYSNLPLRLSWDYGLTPACLVGQLTPRGQLRIYHELVSTDMGVRQFTRDVVVPFLKAKYPNHPLAMFIGTGDPAGGTKAEANETTCMMEIEAQGLNVMPAATNALIPRLEAVKAFLIKMIDGEPGILIRNECRVLRKGFLGGYQFERVAVTVEKHKDQPCKNAYSHPHDALQYMAMDLVGTSGDTRGTRVKAQPEQPAQGYLM